jgi:hypothetical protein
MSTLRVNNIDNTGGTDLSVNGYPRQPGQIIEYLSSPCDGSTVTVGSGSYTFQNVTARQDLTANVFTDNNGSIISYTPPAGATRVLYKYNFAMGWDQIHAISYHKFYIDDVEVTNAKFNASGQYPEERVNFEWPIAIGGTANTASGRQATWTTPKTLKIMSADFGTSNSRFMHSGNYGHLSGNALSQPVLTIIAIA